MSVGARSHGRRESSGDRGSAGWRKSCAVGASRPSFQARACSRPPFPTIRIFTGPSYPGPSRKSKDSGAPPNGPCAAPARGLRALVTPVYLGVTGGASMDGIPWRCPRVRSGSSREEVAGMSCIGSEPWPTMTTSARGDGPRSGPARGAPAAAVRGDAGTAAGMEVPEGARRASSALILHMPLAARMRELGCGGTTGPPPPKDRSTENADGSGNPPAHARTVDRARRQRTRRARARVRPVRTQPPEKDPGSDRHPP